jgi:hypothetical protein
VLVVQPTPPTPARAADRAPSSSIRFVRAVQALGAAARASGLVVPGFRSPPRLRGVQRSIRRFPNGAMVAVVVRGRPWAAVLADLVEGVIAANGLVGPPADAARAALWEALAAEGPVLGAVGLGSEREVVARPAA